MFRRHDVDRVSDLPKTKKTKRSGLAFSPDLQSSSTSGRTEPRHTITSIDPDTTITAGLPAAVVWISMLKIRLVVSSERLLNEEERGFELTNFVLREILFGQR